MTVCRVGSPSDSGHVLKQAAQWHSWMVRPLPLFPSADAGGEGIRSNNGSQDWFQIGAQVLHVDPTSWPAFRLHMSSVGSP